MTTWNGGRKVNFPCFPERSARPGEPGCQTAAQWPLLIDNE